MFHSDSRQRFINAYDYDLRTGDISNRRHVRTMEDHEGRPDGAACDAKGLLLVGGVWPAASIAFARWVRSC